MAKSGTGLQQGTDQYTYWSFPGSGYITLTILNNAADVGFGTTSGASGPEAADYPPNDEYYTPGTLIRPDKFDAIRIKNHIAGSVAQYAIATRLVTDIPSDIPLGASFSPTYITVDPVTGAISAQFTGKVKANGVVLTPNMPGAGSYIEWDRASDGTEIARVYAQESGRVAQAFLQAFGPDANDWTADVQLLAQAFGSGPVNLDVQSNTTSVANKNGIYAGVWNKASTVKQSATILDENAASTFLQLAALAGLTLDWGTVVVQWAAGTNSSLATVTHRLGRIPTLVIAAPINAPAFGNFPTPNVNTLTANNFGLNAEVKTNFGAYPASITFGWIALG